MTCQAPAFLIACLPPVLATVSTPCAAQARTAQPQDPKQREVELPATGGWHGRLLLDQPTIGVWTVGAFDVFPEYGTPEVVGVDDEGRVTILVSYSGKWTPVRAVHEGEWLGGLTHADVDPRVDGSELYVGGERGVLHMVARRGHGLVDDHVIGTLPGHEIHTILAGELDPRTPSADVLAFTRPGGLWRSTPTGEHGGFETSRLAELTGRVRDALVLREADAATGRSAVLVTASRDGAIERLEIGPNGLSSTTIHRTSVGRGRLALAPESDRGPTVIYSTGDDGTVWRHEENGEGAWSTEVIYRGPEGPRGLAAGNFHAEPGVESVAVFGYSRDVVLLSRSATGSWNSERIFRDRGKGHWLAAVELDGRNGTHELVGSGYAGRIFTLSRPVGYGLPSVAGDTGTDR